MPPLIHAYHGRPALQLAEAQALAGYSAGEMAGLVQQLAEAQGERGEAAAKLAEAREEVARLRSGARSLPACPGPAAGLAAALLAECCRRRRSTASLRAAAVRGGAGAPPPLPPAPKYQGTAISPLTAAAAPLR